MRSAIIAFAIVFGVGFGAAQASDADGKFAIKGAGHQPCSAFAEAYDTSSQDLAIYFGWVDGFVTGMNQFRSDTFDVVPWQTTETLLGLLREVCRAQADDPRMIDVANRLIADFYPLRLTQESPLQGVRTDGRSLVIYKDVLQRAEAVLMARNFDPGPVDGIFDEATANAIKDFQTSAGLEVTGLPNQQTLFSLFVRNSQN